MPLDPHQIAGYAWLLFFIVWILLAFTNKRTVRRESLRSRLSYMIPALFGGILLFRSGDAHPSVLTNRLFPETPALDYLALALTITGLLFAIAARLYLGRNWSGSVTLKREHQLIRSGPYAMVRHPIYTGILVALFGMVLLQGKVLSFAGFLIVVIALRVKSLVEEKFMAEHFGDDYLRYRSEVKALVPFVW